MAELWGLLEAKNDIPVVCNAWLTFSLKEKTSYKCSQVEKSNGMGS